MSVSSMLFGDVLSFLEGCQMNMTAMKGIDRKDGYTYHPVFWVSIGSTSSICWASGKINGFSLLLWTEWTERPYPSL